MQPSLSSEASSSDIRIRAMTMSDLEVAFEWQSDPESNQMAVTLPRDRQAFMTHWAAVLKDPTVRAKLILHAKEPVGYVSVFHSKGNNYVGYLIGRAFWGRGMATRGLQLLLEEVRERPLHARVATSNLGSLRVLEKCGFEVERVEFAPAELLYPACEEAHLVLR